METGVDRQTGSIIDRELDKFYDLALDHAVDIIREHYILVNSDGAKVLNSIIKRIKNLKSNDKQH